MPFPGDVSLMGGRMNPPIFGGGPPPTAPSPSVNEGTTSLMGPGGSRMDPMTMLKLLASMQSLQKGGTGGGGGKLGGKPGSGMLSAAQMPALPFPNVGDIV